jgi:hypothetical protein
VATELMSQQECSFCQCPPGPSESVTTSKKILRVGLGRRGCCCSRALSGLNGRRAVQIPCHGCRRSLFLVCAAVCPRTRAARASPRRCRRRRRRRRRPPCAAGCQRRPQAHRAAPCRPTRARQRAERAARPRLHQARGALPGLCWAGQAASGWQGLAPLPRHTLGAHPTPRSHLPWTCARGRRRASPWRPTIMCWYFWVTGLAAARILRAGDTARWDDASKAHVTAAVRRARKGGASLWATPLRPACASCGLQRAIESAVAAGSGGGGGGGGSAAAAPVAMPVEHVAPLGARGLAWR